MRKISDFIVDHCYVIFGIFLVLTGICAILATRVNINRNIYSYMPADSETSLGLEIMNDEFDYDQTSSYEMMLTGVPDNEKSAIKDDIESIDGVSSVDYDSSDEYNRDQYTRYKINVDAPADSEDSARIYDEIHSKYSGLYEIAESGQVYDYNGSVLKIGVVLLAVGFAMVILTIMSQSWVEPWLFLFAILLAVVVNKGTNIIFPSVSHITDSIAAILQMALSMDYAIMLSTRYRQEKAKPDHPDKKTAMRRAMRYSFGAICSSSVTTVVGLIVLVFMSFTIGRDMGLVLSKGVVLSLVSIFTSLPALLLIFDKAIEKTAKKTINFKMDLFGKASFNLRHFALPIFLLVFVGGFLLKGGTAIKFTTEQNNKIKDVFNETNQMALVYDKSMDDEVTKVCNKFDAREDTTRVLCYGNTINEPEKYNELVPKVNELSDGDDIDTEDYLIKALYYHYYKDVDAHQITLSDFVDFLQKEVFPNKNFTDEISSETITKIDQLSNFTDREKVNRLRTKEDIANVLGVKASKLDEVYVLYLSKQNSSVKLTLNEFANFVTNEVLTNPNYASMVTDAQRADLAKLRTFSNSNITNTSKTIAELSKILGIDQATLEQLLVYYNFTTTDNPTATATVSELVNFSLNDENVISELGLSDAEVANIKSQLATAQSEISTVKTNLSSEYNELNNAINTAIAKLPDDQRGEISGKIDELREELTRRVNAAEAVTTKKYSYSDYVNAASTIDAVLDSTTSWLDNLGTNYESVFSKLDEETTKQILDAAKQVSDKIAEIRKVVNLNERLSQLKKVYRLYQAETTASSTKISVRALVNFMLTHKDDDKLKGALNPSTLSQLKLAQYIMNNQTTKYSSGALSTSFSLDAEKIRLVYALYEYRHINTNPMLSLKTLINFIDSEILPNPDYSSRLSENEQTKLSTIAILMRAAESGYPYSYDALYRAILPLADNVDKNQLFLAYLYHGSLYDYDENWALTIEQFVNFLVDKVLPDSRFANRIDDETRDRISDGQKTISDAKELLVGPKHYRALVESNLPAEGDATFALIRDLKDELGPKNKVDYFVVGDSAMAYEMSQSFSGEMDFITVLTMLSIFIVVVFTFKSFFVSLLLVLVIQCAVYIVMSYLSLTGSSIYFIALIIVQSILMGATIDYAILFTSNYIENRSYFKLGIKDALVNTYNRSIGAILTSASILIIVTAIVGNMASAIAGMICQSISLGTFCATVIILVLLPALLAILDKFIVKSASKA